jgi:hypothetical protein
MMVAVLEATATAERKVPRFLDSTVGPDGGTHSIMAVLRDRMTKATVEMP